MLANIIAKSKHRLKAKQITRPILKLRVKLIFKQTIKPRAKLKVKLRARLKVRIRAKLKAMDRVNDKLITIYKLIQLIYKLFEIGYEYKDWIYLKDRLIMIRI